jgi:hypothetical protein
LENQNDGDNSVDFIDENDDGRRIFFGQFKYVANHPRPFAEVLLDEFWPDDYNEEAS